VTCQTVRAIGAHNNNPTPLDFFFRVEAGIQTFLLVDKVWSTYPAVNQILYTNNSRASLPTGRRDKAGGGQLIVASRIDIRRNLSQDHESAEILRFLTMSLLT
jgi:hypothetical protein